MITGFILMVMNAQYVSFFSINVLSFWLKKSFTGMNMQVIAVEIAKEMWIKRVKNA
jgi:hypothetical protein